MFEEEGGGSIDRYCSQETPFFEYLYFDKIKIHCVFGC
jgi:hypothetical protein